MAQQHDDCCLVCADPLEFTAFGACGHKDVCSRCVARMRFVLKDRGCVFCRQENAEVFFTRFMGDYTARLAPDDFNGLKARADRRELFCLPEISGYFDDERHYQDIRALCGFTHPVLELDSRKSSSSFNNFSALKRHIEANYNQFFCDVCVKGRKVFVSEQLLYSKETLRRHQDSGDETGPLAESGFKGHPLCRFCRTRFYDSNELYRHMEGSHEHCFLCRRVAPDKYVYYRHYKPCRNLPCRHGPRDSTAYVSPACQELEDHFTKDHHPCPHPACLERKFVVFNTEYELKAHFASEHGDEVKMSASQRRQALTIPLQLQFRSRDDEETEPGPSARMERAAIVIGGGHNIGSRSARPGRGGAASGMHHSRSEPQFFQTAGAAAQESVTDVSSVTFTAEDFPAPSSSQQGGAGPMGRWAAFAGAQGSAGGLSEQDFPSLPTLSKNQRRRIKEQQRTLAERLSSAAQPPRVINRAAPSQAAGSTGAGSSALGAAGPSHQTVPAVDDFPALSSLAIAPPSPVPSAAGPSIRSAAAVSSGRSADVVAPAPVSRRPPGFGQDQFPALGGGVKARAPPAPPPPASSAYSGAAAGQSVGVLGATGLSQSEVLHSLFMRPGSAASITAAAPVAASATTSAAPPDTTPQLTSDDFPSLPGGAKKGAKQGLAGAKAQAAKQQASKPQASITSAAASQAGGDSSAASASGSAMGGVSNSLKAANKALVERIKRQLSGAAFDTFRQQSLLFMRGDLTADDYHEYMVSRGLLSLVAELVSLCPDAAKRRLLLDVHRTFIASPAAQDPARVGAGWMPPEAAVAKANRVAQHSSWACTRCSLCNAPDDARCEACGAARPNEEQMVAIAPAPPEPSGLTLSARVAASAVLAFRSAAVGSWSANEPQQPALPRAPAADDFPALMGAAAQRGPPMTPTLNGISGDLARVGSGSIDDGATGPSSSGGKGKKGKGTTIKIGLPTSGAGGGGSARPHPQNVWTQPAFKAKTANSWAGQGAGKVTKMHSAINDAWEQ